jgi:hypothetical protein
MTIVSPPSEERTSSVPRGAVAVGIVTLALTAIAACARLPMTSTHDPNADFTALRSFAWTPGPQRDLGDPRVDQELLDALAREAVEEELRSKGYEKDVSGAPDFLVAYDIGVQDRSSTVRVGPSGGYRQGWSWIGRSAPATSSYEQGTLRLRVIDPGNEQVLWQGSVESVVDFKASDEKRGKRVRRAVSQLLRKFPPQ